MIRWSLISLRPPRTPCSTYTCSVVNVRMHCGGRLSTAGPDNNDNITAYIVYLHTRQFDEPDTCPRGRHRLHQTSFRRGWGSSFLDQLHVIQGPKKARNSTRLWASVLQLFQSPSAKRRPPEPHRNPAKVCTELCCVECWGQLVIHLGGLFRPHHSLRWWEL